MDEVTNWCEAKEKENEMEQNRNDKSPSAILLSLGKMFPKADALCIEPAGLRFKRKDGCQILYSLLLLFLPSFSFLEPPSPVSLSFSLNCTGTPFMVFVLF